MKLEHNEIAVDICGTKKQAKGRRAANEKKRRSRQLNRLRRLKRDCRRKWRQAKSSNSNDIQDLHKQMMDAVRAHQKLLKIVRSTKKKVETSQERARFRKDPFRYGQNLLEPPISKKADFTKKTADEHFSKTYTDQNRGKCYDPFPGLPRPPPPEVLFDARPPSWREFSRICFKKSNGSAPGFDGNGYLIFKRCPKLRRILWRIVCIVWKRKEIPLCWRAGWTILLAKSTDTSHPKLMRPITVLNAACRLFWSVFSEKLTDYMTVNKYIDLHIQKAFLAGTSRFIEHDTMQVC